MDDMRQRFTLYGIGFAMGIVIVFFFLGGKRASCNWLPNDRILNIIERKQLLYGEQIEQNLKEAEADSLDIRAILKHGDIDFSKSRVKNEPCRLYWIEGQGKQSSLLISVELCDSVATVSSLKRLPPQ
jgi:hypothetical protein